jgi:hypothetical protein
MKMFLILVSLAVMAALAIELLRFRDEEVARAVALYLLAQITFTAMCWLPFRRFGMNSLSYFQTFYGSMAFIALASIVLSLAFLRPSRGSWIAWPLAEACALFSSGIFATFAVGLAREGFLNRFSVAQIASASALLFCGVLALATLAFPDGMVSDWIRFSLGSYWVMMGLYYFSDAGLRLRRISHIAKAISITPMLISIVIFGCLCLALMGQQREASRSASEPEAAALTARG